MKRRFVPVQIFCLTILQANLVISLDQYASYSQLRSDNSTPAIKCGASMELNVHQAVFIESPNFGEGKKYPNSINCKWNFRLNECTLAITCPNFALNKFLCFDYLQVVDGIGRTKRYCGNEGPQSLYLEQRAEMTFRSSPSFNGAGFRCYAVCVEPGPVTYTELALPSVPYTSLGHCACGRRNRPKKFARHEKFPWVAKLVRKHDQELFCSASLISNKYLISAAHCFSSAMTRNPRNIQVILNEIHADTRGKTAPPPFKRNVVQISRYLNLGSSFETDADIALIKLEKGIEMDNDGIVPVCLPKGENRSLHFQGSKGLLSQWGWNSEWTAHELMNVRSTVVSNDNCASVYKNNVQFTSKTASKTLLCAKPNVPGFCHTISGGALMSMEDTGRYSRYTQIGVGTWGNDCQMGKDLPLIYTRVTEIINWVLMNTQDSSYCQS